VPLGSGPRKEATTNVKAEQSGRSNGKRAFPIVALLAYYGMLVLAGYALIRFVPGFRELLTAPVTSPLGRVDELLTSGNTARQGAGTPWSGPGAAGAVTLTAMVWALAIALPVAWTLMRTRRLRYDPSLVHTVLVLPIVVAGVVLVVKNSLALAFALAGIVAGVRFRQKLGAPEEAVYVLLALGIGLAAGVLALDVALVMSLAFTLVVLTLWRFDIGRIAAGGRGAQLAIGNDRLLSRPDENSDRLRQRYASLGDGMDPHGILLVCAQDYAAARQCVEIVACRLADEWRFTDAVTDAEGLTRFEVLMRLRPDADPAAVIADLEARPRDGIDAARYVPFGTRTNSSLRNDQGRRM
jgi:hypothetical protein